MKYINTIVVEDDADMLFFIETVIKNKSEYKLLGNATTFQNAKIIISALKPELVFLDNYLPDGTGIELMKYLRTFHPTIDVIFITAANDIDTIKTALRHGVFDYLIKPFLIDRLNECLGNYCDYINKQENLSWQQQDIDKRFRIKLNNKDENLKEYPKGIDKITLLQVCNAFDGTHTEHTADSLGKCIGVSKSTARRYLEYCKLANMLEASIIYGTIGRPERVYRLIYKLNTA